MQRRAAKSPSRSHTGDQPESQMLAGTFSVLEYATIGVDAVTSALGELEALVESAARSANMKRRAFFATHYAALREDIETLEAARKRGIATVFGDAAASGETAWTLLVDVDAFRDTALIDAARQSITQARAALNHAAQNYRDQATTIADEIVDLGDAFERPQIDGAAGADDTLSAEAKRASLRDRLLRGLLGSRAA